MYLRATSLKHIENSDEDVEILTNLMYANKIIVPFRNMICNILCEFDFTNCNSKKGQYNVTVSTVDMSPSTLIGNETHWNIIGDTVNELVGGMQKVFHSKQLRRNSQVDKTVFFRVKLKTEQRSLIQSKNYTSLNFKQRLFLQSLLSVAIFLKCTAVVSNELSQFHNQNEGILALIEHDIDIITNFRYFAVQYLVFGLNIISPEKLRLAENKEECLKEARKWGTKEEFKTNAPDAYSIAEKDDFLAECVYADVPVVVTIQLAQQSKEECLKEARKRGTKEEFKTNAPDAYSIAIKNGFFANCVFANDPQLTTPAVNERKGKGRPTKSK